ncbi:uncharacterized protein LOC111309902 isoform X2 [Durio zibethinus]|uniref:Uncharacterized protein LOC111309902 isoform X2 n=1 Tax=Durio zibethinus TaxID=66656 RepID=A0A6P6AIL7_DURZI|nr:uncharacterized protein LOC111309902 isoform X2 [Durio zibethinus]XP_022764646.1 uncharacterized protein LOC111309902 isoform X2 [Durio zibethinus]
MGYLFGQYRHLASHFQEVLQGQGYFGQVLAFKLKQLLIGCFGKIAMHVLEKLVAIGAIPITVSGSNMPCTPEAVDVLNKANGLFASAMAVCSKGVQSSLYPSS